ncbi:Biotin synthesis protein bioH [Methylophaga lonarensis MPL]|uniref:Pimeloyl-[acyl-carrier protein] methyl ester esterase n=1 Tax=Methylophaga lonarensis MPL TaxID=1286106 RepID=M7P158_9GAMM|nr:pimeloyl-ACP methyl ester esterase BioH [Methylophaga lonarensis]EMR13221.1 Biotin synthesis protein bioH [Methylophaga lonarensis MPL]
MHIESLGHGPDLVLLHGWSMHSGIWQPLIEPLQQQFRVHLVDLPGHGLSQWQAQDLQLDAVVDQLAEGLSFPAIWLGWSMGGLIALRLAQRYPTQVQRLILMAATPQFVQTKDWTTAMPAEVFQSFASKLGDNISATLQQFLLIQAKGAVHARQQIRQIAEDLAAGPTPQTGALREGLDLLLNENMRPAVQQLHCPLQWILGSRDSLIPIAVKEPLRALNPAATVHEIDGAGHAPFVSHSAVCLQLIEQFCHD